MWLNKIQYTCLIKFDHLAEMIFLCLLFLIGFSSCTVLTNSPRYQLGNGEYLYKTPGSKYLPVVVTTKDDSLQVIASGGKLMPESNDDLFLKKSFDIDVLTVPAKYRPATVSLPTQLNTEFNGNLFLGYRLDRFRVKRKQVVTLRTERVTHQALTFGLFGGIGATQVTPSTTNRMISDEYNGLIFQRGITMMAGINNLTVGLGAGWDYLTDEKRSVWIYQNQPWYGLTLGLNLN